MDLFAKTVVSVLQFLIDFFSMEGGRDKYVRIGSALNREKPVVPFTRTDVPHLGDDHEELVTKAERLYDNDDLRYKWLMAIHRVRQTKSGWVIDKDSKNRLSPNWGLTPRAA